MPILNLQRQMGEIGRIRIGMQVEFKRRDNTPGWRPAKLDTFRLTSKVLEPIQAAAEIYGGEVQEWVSPRGSQYQVITESDVLDIVVPPAAEIVKQWYELWGGGGCLRRCDSDVNYIAKAPCACPSDVEERIALSKRGEACMPTTRLAIALPKLPGIGLWRLESHGYYASIELPGIAEVLAQATAQGHVIEARLRLEQREKKMPGKPTNRYAVPVIEVVGVRMADLLEAGLIPSIGPGGISEIGHGRRSPQPPGLPAGDLPATSDFRAPAPLELEDEDAIEGTYTEVPEGGDLVESGAGNREEEVKPVAEAAGAVQVEPAATPSAVGSLATGPDLIARLRAVADAHRHLTEPAPRAEWVKALSPAFRPDDGAKRADGKPQSVDYEFIEAVVGAAFGIAGERRDGRLVGWPFERRHQLAIVEVWRGMAAATGSESAFADEVERLGGKLVTVKAAAA